MNSIQLDCLFSRSFTILSIPFLQDINSGLLSVSVLKCTSAPLLSKFSTMVSCSFWQAMYRGLIQFLVHLLILAPFWSKILNVSFFGDNKICSELSSFFAAANVNGVQAYSLFVVIFTSIPCSTISLNSLKLLKILTMWTGCRIESYYVRYIVIFLFEINL